MSQIPDGATPFDHPDWNRRLGLWGFYGGGDFFPMNDLEGHVVNVGTKDGLVYDGATAVRFTADGALVLEGGRKGFPWSPERGVTEMTGPESVHCHDIARGYVHPDGPR